MNYTDLFKKLNWVKDYKDLEVWKRSFSLASDCLKYLNLNRVKGFEALLHQIQKSAVSVPSNIAEGIGRSSNKETIRFLIIARGSLYELETQILLLSESSPMDSQKANEWLEKIKTVGKMLSGLINYFRSKL